MNLKEGDYVIYNNSSGSYNYICKYQLAFIEEIKNDNTVIINFVPKFQSFTTIAIAVVYLNDIRPVNFNDVWKFTAIYKSPLFSIDFLENKI